MKKLFTEVTEKEMYQQIIAAIEQAETEGQPVHEIYEAIQAGAEVQIQLATSAGGKVQVIISV